MFNPLQSQALTQYAVVPVRSLSAHLGCHAERTLRCNKHMLGYLFERCFFIPSAASGTWSSMQVGGQDLHCMSFSRGQSPTARTAQSLLLPFVVLFGKCTTKMKSSSALESSSDSLNSRKCHPYNVHTENVTIQSAYAHQIAWENIKFPWKSAALSWRQQKLRFAIV